MKSLQRQLLEMEADLHDRVLMNVKLIFVSAVLH